MGKWDTMMLTDKKKTTDTYICREEDVVESEIIRFLVLRSGSVIIFKRAAEFELESIHFSKIAHKQSNNYLRDEREECTSSVRNIVS